MDPRSRARADGIDDGTKDVNTSLSALLRPRRGRHGRLRSSRAMGFTLVAVAMTLTGCADARRMVGMDHQPPDEFAVVARAPLSMPPDSSLAAPRPGVARPQESTTRQVAAASVFGQGRGATRTGQTGGESALLAQAGAGRIDPNIRARIDEETLALVVADRRWVDSMLFWVNQEQPYEVVDPARETQRLRDAKAQGKPVNQGEVPTIVRKHKAPLEGLL
jgi:hypothetical protein